MTRTRTDDTAPGGALGGALGGAPVGAADAGIEFDGTRVPFTPGQTIGGALAGAGIVSWRTTRRDHAPRGLFCGIGVCFDCLVTVDGVRSQRACLVEACAGQIVHSSDPEEPLALAELPEASELDEVAEPPAPAAPPASAAPPAPAAPPTPADISDPSARPEPARPSEQEPHV